MTQEEQLREVTKHFGITLDKDQLMTRCPRCNASGVDMSQAVEENYMDLEGLWG